MLEIIIKPRQNFSWDKFCMISNPKSIALDGIVSGGPKWDEKNLRVNFDHHDGVIREATMSTCMQVFFAIKGGLMTRFNGVADIWINDVDQDTALAVWLLTHYKQFEGVQSHPHINRLLTLTDRWDITGGAFPTSLNDNIIEMHSWVFEPYQNLRTSGALAQANEMVMRDCLEAVMSRLDKLFMGQSGFRKLNTQYNVLHTSKFGFMIVDEFGGNEARCHLFSKGMDAFINRVAVRDDGREVWSIGRRSRYIDFPVVELYSLFNKAEGLSNDNGWGGSDIIGGSSRLFGSNLGWETLRDITENYLESRT